MREKNSEAKRDRKRGLEFVGTALQGGGGGVRKKKWYIYININV